MQDWCQTVIKTESEFMKYWEIELSKLDLIQAHIFSSLYTEL